MIELRWLTKMEQVPNNAPFMQEITVLQYRAWHVRLDASGAITPTPLPIEWTPWQDVPCVKDPT